MGDVDFGKVFSSGRARTPAPAVEGLDATAVSQAGRARRARPGRFQTEGKSLLFAIFVVVGGLFATFYFSTGGVDALFQVKPWSHDSYGRMQASPASPIALAGQDARQAAAVNIPILASSRSNETNASTRASRANSGATFPAGLPGSAAGNTAGTAPSSNSPGTTPGTTARAAGGNGLVRSTADLARGVVSKAQATKTAGAVKTSASRVVAKTKSTVTKTLATTASAKAKVVSKADQEKKLVAAQRLQALQQAQRMQQVQQARSMQATQSSVSSQTRSIGSIAGGILGGRR